MKIATLRALDHYITDPNHISYGILSMREQGFTLSAMVEMLTADIRKTGDDIEHMVAIKWIRRLIRKEDRYRCKS